MSFYDIKLRIDNTDLRGLAVCYGSKVLGYIGINGVEVLPNSTGSTGWHGRDSTKWTLASAVEIILRNHAKDMAENLSISFTQDADLDSYKFKPEGTKG